MHPSTPFGRKLVLERGSVGESWRGRYDRLHLHTARRLSGLPGMPIPRSCGRWVARDDLVRYLEAYAKRHGLDVRMQTTVERIEHKDRKWELVTRGWSYRLARGHRRDGS